MLHIFHRLLENPRIYELVQCVAGTNALDRCTAPLIATAIGDRRTGVVLDVGGGTGRARKAWPVEWEYVCLEPDPRKILAVNSGFSRIVANAADLPIGDGSVDIVIMRLVAHHLDASVLKRALRESHRVLRPSGVFLLVEPLWCEERLLSRLLWRYDIGRHPRTPQLLMQCVATSTEISEVKFFKTFHQFILIRATKTGIADEEDEHVFGGRARIGVRDGL